jgi:hypothetical protein
MTVIKRTNNKKMLARMPGIKEIGTPIHYWKECKLVLPLWKSERRLLKNQNKEVQCDPTYTSVYIPKRIKVSLQQKDLHIHVHYGTVKNTQIFMKLD